MLYFGSDLWKDSVQITVGRLHPSLWLHVRLTSKYSSISVSSFPLLSSVNAALFWKLIWEFISDSGKTTTKNCNGSFISNIADPFLQYSLFLSWFPNEKLIWISCKICPYITDIFVVQYQYKQKLCLCQKIYIIKITGDAFSIDPLNGTMLTSMEELFLWQIHKVLCCS